MCFGCTCCTTEIQSGQYIATLTTTVTQTQLSHEKHALKGHSACGFVPGEVWSSMVVVQLASLWHKVCGTYICVLHLCTYVYIVWCSSSVDELRCHLTVGLCCRATFLAAINTEECISNISQDFVLEYCIHSIWDLCQQYLMNSACKPAAQRVTDTAWLLSLACRQ